MSPERPTIPTLVSWQQTAAAFVEVRPQAPGGRTHSDRTYVPLLADFLIVGHPLPFGVYCRVRNERLEMLVEKGTEFTSEMKAKIERNNQILNLYIRADESHSLVQYQEEVIGELLTDKSIQMRSKCRMIQNLTTSLSEQMFEKPTVASIGRQRENVFRMVDFVLREPQATKGLVRLTHHDYYTYTHSVNVGIYGLLIAEAHLSRRERHNLHEIASGFFLHDLGKCRVPSEIINKNGPLDDDEWKEIRKHPTYGMTILEESKMLGEEERVIVVQHHEKMDGRGYPLGLKGHRIHPYARICSVADAFDALTTQRSYKPALLPFEALAIMKEEMHAQFDSDVFTTFVLLMKKRGEYANRA
ncbi:HD-GYP domain-containing protein [Candidatus Sumerlaeota bacterium]|nr:HD-GYP domain-containing protein [Candidatus Sumerlaeota bacterium]